MCVPSHVGEGGPKGREKDGKCERNGRGKIRGGNVKKPSQAGTCERKSIRYKRKDKGK
jgi:hypothetical protein